VEQQTACVRGPAVEAEGELVQVVVEMLVAHRPLMSAQQPPFEQRGNPVHTGQGDVGRVSAGRDDRRLALIAVLGDLVVALPAVGVNDGTRFDSCPHERGEVRGRDTRNALDPHPAEALG